VLARAPTTPPTQGATLVAMADAPGPASLVALRDRRDHVIAVLSDQFSRDLLEVDELERRLELAQRAETVAALELLVADLEVPETALAARPAMSETALGEWPARRRVASVFGSVEKGGTWTVARQLTAVAVFGSTQLDFRDAAFAPGVTELRVRCVFGSVEVIVPPWLAVESDATAILGSFEELHRAPIKPDPERAVLRITGVMVFGSVEVETRLSGESRRDARKRSKRQGKALQGEDRKALPAARARPKSGD